MRNRSRLMPFKKLKADLMKNPEFQREYDKVEAEFQIAQQIIEARTKQKLSQKELARRMGTGQAVVSRLEGMNARPSLSLLERVARALKIELTLTVR